MRLSGPECLSRIARQTIFLTFYMTILTQFGVTRIFLVPLRWCRRDHLNITGWELQRMGAAITDQCWKLSHGSFFIHRQQGAALLTEVGVEREDGRMGISEWIREWDKGMKSALWVCKEAGTRRPAGRRVRRERFRFAVAGFIVFVGGTREQWVVKLVAACPVRITRLSQRGARDASLWIFR